MAQHEATNGLSYEDSEGDRYYTFNEGDSWWVACVYADQSPQFIRCDGGETEARELFARITKTVVHAP